MTHAPVAVFMVAMGLGIAGIWTVDIVRGDRLDLRRGALRARDTSGSLLLPHWIAEYGTAAALLVGAVGLGAQAPWGEPLAAAALGATLYTSTNSLGWALAQPSRRAYAGPMLAGLTGSLASLAVLLA